MSDWDRDMHLALSRELTDLWRAVGELKALANPEGVIAARLVPEPERRLAEIWKVVEPLEPGAVRNEGGPT